MEATAVMPAPVAVLRVVSVSVSAVGATVDLEDDGAQCDEQADAHTAQKHQGCALGLV